MNLLKLLRPFGPQILLALLLSLPPAVAQALLPGWVVKPLFDQVLAGQFERLGAVLWVGGGLLLGLVLGSYAQEAFMGYLSIRIPASLRAQIFERLLGANLASVPASAGGLAGRIVGDLRELESFVFFSLGGLLIQGVSFLAILGQLLLHYTELTLYMLLVLPLLALLLAWIGRLVTHYSHRTQAALERLAGRMAEGFGRLEFIRALGLEGFARARFLQANRLQYRMGRTRALLSALNLPLGQLATTLLLGFLLALGVGQVQQGKMTSGDLTAFLTLLALAITPLQTLARAGILYAQGEGSAARVNELLSLPGASAGGTLAPATLEGSLELKGVSFAYPGTQEVLDGLDLSFPAGSFTALVGASGSGKSTVLRLLLGLYPPSQGQVLLDGRPLEAYRPDWLRSKVAWVPQEPLLFEGSLRENLQALAPQADEAHLRQALERVGLGEISLEQRLEDDGSGLSVGQRQRLAIAAALLRQAKVLLLDEITSALDRGSEAQVTAALEAVRPGRTLILVAHRLSTVRSADRIVVMEQGRVVEAGTHAELLAQQGLYSQLWRSGEV